MQAAVLPVPPGLGLLSPSSEQASATGDSYRVVISSHDSQLVGVVWRPVSEWRQAYSSWSLWFSVHTQTCVDTLAVLRSTTAGSEGLLLRGTSFASDRHEPTTSTTQCHKCLKWDTDGWRTCCFQTSGSLTGPVGSQCSPFRSHQIVVIRDRTLLPGKRVSIKVSIDFLCTVRSSSDSSCCCASPACALQETETECTKQRVLMHHHSPHLSTVSDNIKTIRSLCFCNAGYSPEAFWLIHCHLPSHASMQYLGSLPEKAPKASNERWVMDSYLPDSTSKQRMLGDLSNEDTERGLCISVWKIPPFSAWK